jgi:hypothetical protein
MPQRLLRVNQNEVMEIVEGQRPQDKPLPARSLHRSTRTRGMRRLVE